MATTTPTFLTRFGQVCDRALRQCVWVARSEEDADEDSKLSQPFLPAAANATRSRSEEGYFLPSGLYENLETMLTNHQVLVKSEKTRDARRRRHDRYKARLDDVVLKNQQALLWMRLTCDPALAVESISMLQTREQRYEKALDDLEAHVSKQAAAIENAWNRWDDQIRDVRLQLREGQATQRFDGLLDHWMLEPLEPIDKEELEEDEEDCRIFLAAMREEEVPKAWVNDDAWETAMIINVGTRRDQLAQSNRLLRAIERGQVTEGNDAVPVSAVDDARSAARRAEAELDQAIAIVRRFVECTSNGSIPSDAELGDIHPDELTDAEIDAMASEVVDNWSCNPVDHLDPERAGPPSPRSDEQGSFRCRLSEVSPEESISQAGDLIDPELPLIAQDGHIRGLIDSWTSENARIRHENSERFPVDSGGSLLSLLSTY